MSVLADARMYCRFALGLPGFLRRQITLDEARETIRKRIREREESFLRLAERGVFGYARSPYRGLLAAAGCEFGDLRQSVKTNGLEGALRQLREAGVYVTFEEFKGREPLVRDGREIPIEPSDFDNPFLKAAYSTQTGGSTGAGSRVSTDLDHVTDVAPALMLSLHAHDAAGLPLGIYRGTLPDSSGIGRMLATLAMGQVPRRWFTPIIEAQLRPPLRFRAATRYIVGMSRLCGVRAPWPEPLPLARAAVVARWMAETVKSDGGCVLAATLSVNLRVCLAAKEERIDLSGAVFTGAGEPPTPAKVKGILDTGARYVGNYYFAEVGPVGLSCANPADVNDQHFMKDHLAVLACPRRVPGTEQTVNAFNFTTLLPSVPKLLLNVEIDDYGVIETRSCGCPLGELGLTEHLHHVRSFRKLTGEGVTLVGSEMEEILNTVLPARFGGSPLDYQLIEEEDEKGFTRLNLAIDPSVAIADEAAVIDAVFEALRRSSLAADMAQSLWSQGETLRVRRMKPIWTARGKHFPIRLITRADGERGAAARCGGEA